MSATVAFSAFTAVIMMSRLAAESYAPAVAPVPPAGALGASSRGLSRPPVALKVMRHRLVNHEGFEPSTRGLRVPCSDRAELMVHPCYFFFEDFSFFSKALGSLDSRPL